MKLVILCSRPTRDSLPLHNKKQQRRNNQGLFSICPDTGVSSIIFHRSPLYDFQAINLLLAPLYLHFARQSLEFLTQPHAQR